MASEMLYPVVPVYLKEIGFSVLLIGVLEGIAEATAGISKGYFGKQSDLWGRRLPFVRWGYFLSALSKPMMALFTAPLWIFFSRTTDRLGKGLRTAPRDALLSQNATPQTKGRVFAFHRSLDTLGAVAGPALALLYLHFFPQHYRPLFFLAAIPGLVAVLLLLFLKEKKSVPIITPGKSFFSFFRYWNVAPAEYKKLVVGLLLFTLINSSDVFLLLRTKELTGSDATTITAYIFYNLVYAAASYPLGRLADAWGFRKVFIGGLLLFAVVYFMFGIATSTPLIFSAFFIYGIYAAATESIAKAWITNIAHGGATATAVGFYTSCQSICSLLASVVAGLLWSTAGPAATFLFPAAAALLLLFYFLFAPKTTIAA
jgi:MFS family permease